MTEHNPQRPDVPLRYEVIDQNSDRSWYMTQERPFEVYQSVATVKPSAARFGEHAVRQTLAGNMSDLYPKIDSMTDDDRYNEALKNMVRFYRSIGLTPLDMANTVILLPQRQYDIPLQPVDVDSQTARASMIEPSISNVRGDFLYTYNKDTVLAARPADCPIVFATAQTPRGEVLTLTHLAWQGAASGFVGDMLTHYDELGIDRSSLKLFITPGGQAESFPYTNAPQNPIDKYPDTHGLFLGVTQNTTGTFDFAIDTPHFVYDELLKNGFAPEQIYADTSDTSRLDSGYSSHGRAARSNGEEINIRDIVLAKRAG